MKAILMREMLKTGKAARQGKALQVQHLHPSHGGDAANAGDAHVTTLARFQHLVGLVWRSGEQQLVVVATGQGEI